MTPVTATDCCVFHDWALPSELFPYLSDGWREVVERPGDMGGMLRPNSSWVHAEPSLEPDRPRSSWTFRDVDTLRSAVLESGDRDRVILGYHENLLTTASPYHYLASELVTATNDWTAHEWLEKDSRLNGMVLVYAGLPDHAADEIRRVGKNPQMVAVALGVNGLSNLFGHPIYHPIYAAAAEQSLPVVIQVESDAAADLGSHPIAGGLPTTFGEYRAMSVQPVMTHVASMITEGVFEKFPTLKLLIVGGGLTWVGSFVWRLGYWFKSLEREAPWLTRLPSAYFFDHVRLSTYSMETVPTPAQLAQALSSVPELQRMVVYASGAPSMEAAGVEETLARLPKSWHADVLHRTADDLFRWSNDDLEQTADDAALLSGGQR